MLISLKIDVMKIEKARLFTGAKGTYLDAIATSNRDGRDKFGNDGMIVQGVTKEERLDGKRGAIIGNFKIIKGDVPQQSQQNGGGFNDGESPF